MIVGDSFSRNPVFFFYSNHFHLCEPIIKVFTSLCKCPNSCMIKPSEIQLNQDRKLFYTFRWTFITTARGVGGDEHRCLVAGLAALLHEDSSSRAGGWWARRWVWWGHSVFVQEIIIHRHTHTPPWDKQDHDSVSLMFHRYQEEHAVHFLSLCFPRHKL